MSENLDITLIAIDVACAVVMATLGLEPLTRARVLVAARHAHAGVCKQARDAAVVISLALQHGVPIESLGHAITRDRSGAAASILDAVIDCVSAKTFSEGGTR